MSSALVTPPSGAPASAAPAKLTAGELLIAARIAQAQAALWRAELLQLLLKLVIAALAGLLLWAVVDHWIWSPGPLVRALVLASGVAAALWWIATRILPLLRGKIRAEYAAQSLEQDLPQLRHALTSYVTLRDDVAAEGPRGAVVRSIGARAAGQIKQHQVDVPSEAAGTFTWWIVLAATLAITAAYALVSPKNTLQSTQRLLLPLAGIEAPTRVAIEDVQPGDCEALAERPLAISAQIVGLAQPDEPAVQYGPDFRQRATLQFDSASGRFVANVRVSKSTHYRIAAGDAVSQAFHISVRAVPVASVRGVQIAPPHYTGLPQRQSAGGAVTAEENSLVTVTATTNRPVERASVEFNPRQAGTRSGPVAGSVPMEIAAEGLTAAATFPVRLPRGAHTAVPVDSYRIRVWDAEGNENPDPIVYPVRIIPDLPPEVAVVVPREVVKEVPIHSQQLFEITALDPDYGLRQIELIMQRGIDAPTTEIIWSSDTAVRGNQIVEYRFRPQALGLRVGDKVSVVAAAVDNRQDLDGQPAPNRSETQPIELVIVAAQQIPPASTPEDGLSEPDEEPANPAAPSADQPRGDSGEPSESGNGQGGSSGAPGSEAGGDEQPSDAGAGGGDQPDNSAGSAAGDDQQSGSQGGGSGDSPNDQEKAPQNGQGAQGGQSSQGAQGTQGEKGAQGEQEAMSDQDAQNGAESADGQGAAGEPSGANEQGGAGQQGDAPQQGSAGQQGDASQQGDTGASAEGDSADTGPAGQDRRGQQAAGGENADGGENAAGGENASGGETSSRGDDSAAGESAGPPPPSSDGSPMSSDQAGNDAAVTDDTAANNDAAASDDGTASSDGQASDGGGAKSSPGEGETSQPAAPPEHDGDAFERIRDYLEQQREKSSPSRDAPNQPQPNQPQPDESQGQPGSAAGSDNAGDPADSPTAASEGDAAGAGQQPEQDSMGQDSMGQESMGQESGSQEQAGQPQTDQQAPTAGEPDAASPASSESAGGDAAGTGGAQAAGQPADSADAAGEPGERSEPAESNGEMSDQAGSSDAGSPSSGDAAGDSNASSGAPQPGDAGFGAEGGGEAGNHDARPPDPVDLEHARKATDLVLDYLDQNRDTPDPELLERLNWTPDELRAFSERWRELLRSQDSDNGGDPQQVEEALRSLGLRQRPEGPIGQRRGQDDAMRGLRDSGNRPPAPTLYRDAFEAFRRSVGRP